MSFIFCVSRKVGGTNSDDDYESIEEIKANNNEHSDNHNLEWRVLSSLGGEMGEDWRIVNSMPRNKNKPENCWRPACEQSEEFKETCKINELELECKHLSIMGTNNVNNVASNLGCEQPINAKSFLEKLLTRNSEDFYRDVSEESGHLVSSTATATTNNSPAGWLRKQVTFGKLLVFS